MSENIDESPKKGFIIFGRDISKIPCFRDSFLYGIGGGLFFGLARFMVSSQPLKSCNFAVYSFSFITVAYWIQCRYTFSKRKFEMMRMQQLLQTQAILEGVAEEDVLNSELGSKPTDV